MWQNLGLSLVWSLAKQNGGSYSDYVYRLRFNDDYSDATGNVGDAVPAGAINFIDTPDGRGILNESGAYIRHLSDVRDYLQPLNDFTISAFVYLDGTTNKKRIFGVNTSTGEYNKYSFHFGMGPTEWGTWTNNIWGFHYYTPTSNSDRFNYVLMDGLDALAGWYLITLVNEGGVEKRLYANALSAANGSSAHMTSLPIAARSVYSFYSDGLGWWGQPDAYTAFNMSEIILWDRCLTQQEHLALMEALLNPPVVSDFFVQYLMAQGIDAENALAADESTFAGDRREARAGRCWLYDGIGGYSDMAVPRTLAGDFVIEQWVQIDGAAANGRMLGDTATLDGIFYDNANGCMRFRIQGTNILFTGIVVTYGSVYRVVSERVGADVTITLFDRYGDVVAAETKAVSSGNLSLGRIGGASSTVFEGQVWGIKIYDNGVLTDYWPAEEEAGRYGYNVIDTQNYVTHINTTEDVLHATQDVYSRANQLGHSVGHNAHPYSNDITQLNQIRVNTTEAGLLSDKNDGGTGIKYIVALSTDLAAGETYNFSAKVKDDTAGEVGFNCANGSYTVVDLVGGSVVSGPGSVEDMGDGWYRLHMTGTAVGGGSSADAIKIVLSQGGNFYYAANGASVYVADAQISKGAALKPYQENPSDAVNTGVILPLLESDPQTDICGNTALYQGRTTFDAKIKSNCFYSAGDGSFVVTSIIPDQTSGNMRLKFKYQNQGGLQELCGVKNGGNFYLAVTVDDHPVFGFGNEATSVDSITLTEGAVYDLKIAYDANSVYCYIDGALVDTLVRNGNPGPGGDPDYTIIINGANDDGGYLTGTSFTGEWYEFEVGAGGAQTTYYTASEGAGPGLISLTPGSVYHGSVINGVEATYRIVSEHATPWNLTKGFDLWSRDADGAVVRIPYDTAGNPVATTGDAFTGHTWISTHPAGAFHNGAESVLLPNRNSAPELLAYGLDASFEMAHGGNVAPFAISNDVNGNEYNYRLE